MNWPGNGALIIQMTHYETLRVVSWAEDAVIRAAYRALMRIYHPDTNQDPEAQLRVREITAAFAVLGDPAKRAAYDAFPTLGNESDTLEPPSFAAEPRTRWPTRSVGFVSAGMAVLVLGLTVTMWPQFDRPRQRVPSNRGRNAHAARIAPLVEPLPIRNSRELHGQASPAASDKTNRQPTLAAALAREKISGVANSRSAIQARYRDRGSQLPIATKVTLPKPGTAAQASNVTAGSPAGASCTGDSSSVNAGKCRDDRLAQVERIAAIFFKQSMDHADSHKQQLLLSARTRSAFSRALCLSSDCVTQSYLRQMRDTTEIMQGRVPTP